MKTAIITGVAGQDGSFLAESLLAQGFEVHGLVRPSTRNEIPNLVKAREHSNFHSHDIDLLETEAMVRLVKRVQPVEFYNLAACSFVPASWELPDYVSQVNGLVPLRILETIRAYSPGTRFYQAGSSEMFGLVKSEDLPLHERSYHHPRSPYGVSKSFAHNIVRNYRESFGLHATNGILFNHESERRDERFVTRKITSGLVKWSQSSSPLRIGNLDSRRDWGYSPDYVEAMQLMVRYKKADDWVIATGQKHTVREFIEEAAHMLGIHVTWRGEGIDERGFSQENELVVEIDSRFYRPAEVDVLEGNAHKARSLLGWKPNTTFKQMVKKMVVHDVNLQGAQKVLA